MTKSNATELLKVIDRFPDAPVVVVGDLIVDHYIWGRVDRISPEAPVVVVEQTEESKRPGGAGNVVSNLACLGAKVSLCGVVGDDDAGRELISTLEESGVEVGGVLVDRSRPTTIKTRVIAHAQQVVRVDREDTSPLAETFTQGIGAAMESRFESSKAVIVSDYAKGAVCPAIFQRIKRGYDNGILGLDKIPVLVDPKGPNFSLYTHASVIKPNRKEASEASGVIIRNRADALSAGKILLEKWGSEMILITLGEDGMVLVTSDKREEPAVEIDTVARDVYDVSGAGDTVSAVFALSLAVGSTPRQAANLANIAAGVVVGEVGTVAINLDQLRDAVSRQSNNQ